MSMVTLTIAGAMFTQFWNPQLNLYVAVFILLTAMLMMNACGVRVRFDTHGRVEMLTKPRYMETSNGVSNGSKYCS